ncbi:hypothetical protein [Streptomyces niveus]|uniref:hypothetical protein n=1 Tax=Streptomyces niveus TaxID=193462 RepID=UPI0035D86C2C
MRKSRLATVVSIAAAVTMLGNTTAYADGHELATELSRPGLNEWVCAETSSARGCFYHDGDWFSVSDLKSDGHSAVVYWQLTNGRWGYIWNNAGNATMRYKNKDFPEDMDVEIWACTGEWGTKEITPGSCSSMQPGNA